MIKLELFGHPKVVAETSSDLPFTKPAYLLIYLACRADWVTRDELAVFFRPDADEKTARHNLRLLLTRARKFDWAQALEQEGNRLRYLPDSDLASFRTALGQANWKQAAELYKAEFLKDAPSLDLATFESWLEVERASLATAWQDAALKYVADLIKSEQHEKAVTLLAKVLRHDPLAEDVMQAYLRSSYLAGKVSTALSAYQDFKTQLKAELELEPLAETQALAATIERSETLMVSDPSVKVEVPLVVLKPPVMVGRSKEKSILADQAVRLAVITGEAGIGKSRLLSDVVPNALWLCCREGLTHVAYFPLVERIKSLETLPELGAYQADLARLIPDVSNSQAQPTDTETAKTRLMEALALTLESQNTPLIFDDLQWADSATLEFFVFMANRSQTKLYATVRSRERSTQLNDAINSLRQLTGFKALELLAFSQEDVAELLAKLSPETGEARAFSEWLALKSGGNAFFLLETLRALFEAQVLQVGQAGWFSSLDSVTQAYAELAIPSGVAALVERRVKGLSEEAKRVLDVSAVLAENIQAELIAKLAGLSLWAASDAIVELEEQGFLANTSFSHDLARQALYEALPKTKRRFLHKQIADALANTSDELIAAEHYYQADELEKAAELWFLVAGVRYTQGNFSKEATALFERIVALDIDTPDFYRAQARLAGEYHSMNRLDEKDTLIDSVLKNSNDTYARAFALLQQTTGYFLKGEMSKAEASLKAAERQVIDFDVPGLQRDVYHARVHIDYYQGRFEDALELSERILAEQRQLKPDYGSINWLSTTAFIYCSIGRFEEALVCYYEAYEIAKKLNFIRSQVQTASDIMSTLYDINRIQEGLALGEEALKLGDFDVTFPLRYNLALAYTEKKHYKEAIEQCQKVIKGASSLNTKGHTYALLAEIQTELKDSAAAYKALDEGLNIVEKADHNEAKAMMTIAALKFGSEKHAKRVQPLVKALSTINLPAYIKSDFDAAIALERYT